MQALIDVYRMNEICPTVRADIIIKLGKAINNQYAMNITEPLVYELVKLIYPNPEVLKKILKDDRYFEHEKINN